MFSYAIPCPRYGLVPAFHKHCCFYSVTGTVLHSGDTGPVLKQLIVEQQHIKWCTLYFRAKQNQADQKVQL